jgi:hypothetical protein
MHVYGLMLIVFDLDVSLLAFLPSNLNFLFSIVSLLYQFSQMRANIYEANGARV